MSTDNPITTAESAVRLVSKYRSFVLPIYGLTRNNCCSCREGWGCTAAGKHPGRVAPYGVKDASRDLGKIRWWWRQAPFSNIGVATGPSWLLVVDVDPRNGGLESLSTLTEDVGDLPQTLTTLTGGGGQHYWYKIDPFSWCCDADGTCQPEDREPVPSGKLGPGLDIQAAGRYVVVPPSRHASGGTYRWQDPTAPVVPAPGWLLDWKTTRNRIDFGEAA